MLLYFSIASFLVGLGIVLTTIPSGAAEDDRFCTPSNDVRFLLFKQPRDPTTHYELFCGNAANLQRSGFNSTWRTKILIHGFRQNWYSSFPQNVKDAYTKRKFNIIVVDWSSLAGSSLASYPRAVANVPTVGKRIGALINFLKRERYTTEDQIHVIGFSLGAHVASNTGAHVHEKTRKKIARITGLDPARPGFTKFWAKVNDRRRLTWNDAKFVDIIHTNAGFLGYTFSLGHVDFYPNGGISQPKCSTTFPQSACSHNMAPTYFAWTIANRIWVNACMASSYPAYQEHHRGPCMSSFGEDVYENTSGGKYYLNFQLPLEFSPSTDFEELPTDDENTKGDDDETEGDGV